MDEVHQLTLTSVAETCESREGGYWGTNAAGVGAVVEQSEM